MKKILLPICLIFGVSLSSCTKDTCNAKLGDTFLSIDTPTINQNIIGRNVLNADMQTLDDLTEAYFEATTLIKNDRDRFGNDWQNDDAIVEEISFHKSNFSIEFKQIDLANYGAVALHFRLRDRQEFIDCEHGGSGDSYFLDIYFSIIENTDGELSLVDFSWEEDFEAGPY